MSDHRKRIAVAGHICLDIIPSFERTDIDLSELIQPGRLLEVGPAQISTGGAVSNTGLALYHLGHDPVLFGKIGADPFGEVVQHLLRDLDPSLPGKLIVSPEDSTSYTVVISPPETDRFFFHSPGANHSFVADDVEASDLDYVELLHFGYPTAMRSMYRDDGEELRELFDRANDVHAATSLDMTYPDPDSEEGTIDWERYLTRILPRVDFFLPNLEETLFMLDRNRLQKMEKKNSPVEHQLQFPDLRTYSGRLLEMGAGVVGLKLGGEGLYVRTSSEEDRFQHVCGDGLANEAEWINRELLAPAFEVDVEGTTGAGDCTIAGFLSAWTDRCSIEQAAERAVAAGGFSVESLDATSGIPDVDRISARMKNGWKRRPVHYELPENWHWNDGKQVLQPE